MKNLILTYSKPLIIIALILMIFGLIMYVISKDGGYLSGSIIAFFSSILIGAAYYEERKKG